MSTSDKPVFSKGDRAAVVAGRSGLGVRGEVFWTGENKYGPGMRYGLRGDNGKTYWLDDECIGTEKDAPEPPPVPEGQKGPAFDKGDRVTIVEGPTGMGVSGKVFWLGESRYSKQPRYGVKGDDEETYWVDHEQVIAEEGGGNSDNAATGPAGGQRGGGQNSRDQQGRGPGRGNAPQQRGARQPYAESDPYVEPAPYAEPYDGQQQSAGLQDMPPANNWQVSDDELPPEAFMDEQSLDDFSGAPPDDR